jgi:hypothetical protein
MDPHSSPLPQSLQASGPTDAGEPAGDREGDGDVAAAVLDGAEDGALAEGAVDGFGAVPHAVTSATSRTSGWERPAVLTVFPGSMSQFRL